MSRPTLSEDIQVGAEIYRYSRVWRGGKQLPCNLQLLTVRSITPARHAFTATDGRRFQMESYGSVDYALRTPELDEVYQQQLADADAREQRLMDAEQRERAAVHQWIERAPEAMLAIAYWLNGEPWSTAEPKAPAWRLRALYEAAVAAGFDVAGKFKCDGWPSDHHMKAIRIEEELQSKQ